MTAPGWLSLADRRFLLTAALTCLLALYFWIGSRYPALDEKALMGADTRIEAIGFDTLVAVPEGASFPARLAGNTLNWMHTNRKGMTFGVLFGALLMTLWPFLRHFHPRSRLANTVVGAIIGAPLGLCVNCSTPVSLALRAAGARPEAALAAMVSSPTLNAVVLSMVFALFPLHIALVKISLTLGFILIGIPLLTRLVPLPAAIAEVPLLRATGNSGLLGRFLAAPDLQDDPAAGNPSWPRALAWFGRHFLRNLWFVTKTTVPLMIVAGGLGAALVTILPFDVLAGLFPTGTRAGIAAGMIATALIGTFLPVPMAFDVIVTAILLNAGLPIRFVANLLFTLGVFSIYPFLVLWRTTSRALAVAVFLGVAALGTVAGQTSFKLHGWETARQEQFLQSAFAAIASPLAMPRVPRQSQGEPDQELLARLRPWSLRAEAVERIGALSIERLPFAPAAREGAALFTRVDGPAFGLKEHDNHSVLKITETLASVRGIASGDTNNDGWIDVVIGSDSGFGLYLNQQGRGFVQQRVEIPELEQWFVVAVALVDLDNDGWLDLFFSTFGHGNYVIYNQRGRFLRANMKRLPNLPDAVMTLAPAFGDIDRDGRLDVVLGNAVGSKASGKLALLGTRNAWLRQTDRGFELSPLPGPNGETLTSLLSDYNGDGWLDLIVGNESDPPDVYYLGDGHGGLRMITQADRLIPRSGRSTMSIVTADVDNDLVPEIYVGQISRGERSGRKLTAQQICVEHTERGARQRCEAFWTWMQVSKRAQNPGPASICLSLKTREEREGCLGQTLLSKARATRDHRQCALFPAGWDYFPFLCAKLVGPTDRPTDAELAQAIPQVPGHNLLLVRNATGSFDDRAKEFGLREGGVTWNAKFADLNNDGWLDLYIVGGLLHSPIRDPHYLYLNQAGRRFTDATSASGLTSRLDTVAYTYVDIDHDGDLDIIAVPAVGPVVVYLNQSPSGHAIRFQLRDFVGNRSGIGSTIVIEDGGGRRQLREIQASGGYLSFDAPQAHFGLGDARVVKRVEIRWSTGERSVIERDFEAGALYTIIREAPPAAGAHGAQAVATRRAPAR